MKILVLGSTGATGRAFTSLAVQRGHTVRVLVRDASSPHLSEGVEVVTGDARSGESLTTAMAGVDITVSALGMGLKTTPTGLMVDAAKALITGASATHTNRLVMLSSWGVGDTLRRSSLPVRLMYLAGRRVHNEKATAEALLRASSLDWTFVYPVALTNGAATGLVRARDLDEVDRIPGTPHISRLDVSQSMIEITEADSWIRRTVVLDTE